MYFVIRFHPDLCLSLEEHPSLLLIDMVFGFDLRPANSIRVPHVLSTAVISIARINQPHH